MSCCCEEGPFGAIIAPLKALAGATDESLGVKLHTHTKRDYSIEKAKKGKVFSELSSSLLFKLVF